ncbi:MAG: DUF6161 domain-containing protein [Phycisphaerales bacterium JB050]
MENEQIGDSPVVQDILVEKIWIHSLYRTIEVDSAASLFNEIDRAYEIASNKFYIGTEYLLEAKDIIDYLKDQFRDSGLEYETRNHAWFSQNISDDIKSSLAKYFDLLIPEKSAVLDKMKDGDESYYSQGFYHGAVGYISRRASDPQFVGYELGYAHGFACRMKAQMSGLGAFNPLAKTARGVSSRIEAMQEQAGSLEKRFERQWNSSEQVKKKIEGLAKILAEEEDRIDQLEKTSSDAIEGIIEQHREQLALREPVKYWESRIKEYTESRKSAAAKYFIGVTVAIILFIACLYVLVAPETALGGIAEKAMSPLSIWERTALLTVPVALIIWVVRVLLRQYLSVMHLYEDAKHRLIVLESYLSMLSLEDRPVTDEERSIVLKSIFMPIEDGLVKDELTPTLWFFGRPKS